MSYNPGDTYQIESEFVIHGPVAVDENPHAGHIVTVVAVDVPIPSLGFDSQVIGLWPKHVIVKCECGSLWSFGEDA